jgi:predicted transcriptional regulator
MAEQNWRYFESEKDIVRGIKRGLDDIEAGRTIPHDEAMRRIRRRIARVASTIKQKSLIKQKTLSSE